MNEKISQVLFSAHRQSSVRQMICMKCIVRGSPGCHTKSQAESTWRPNKDPSSPMAFTMRSTGTRSISSSTSMQAVGALLF